MKKYPSQIKEKYRKYSSALKPKLEKFIDKRCEDKISKMKVYLFQVDGEYKICASKKKNTLKSKLDKWVEKKSEGRIKSMLEKYIDKLENNEESTLKMANKVKDLDIIYFADISEQEAKGKCKEMSQKYLQENLWPIIIYGILTPITFVAAPFLPIVNWGFSFYFGYKCYGKYNSLKGYKKILNSDFIKSEENQNLEAILKRQCRMKK